MINNQVILVALVIGTIIRMLLTPTILGYGHSGYSFYLSKFYDSLLIAAVMALVQLFTTRSEFSMEEYIMWFVILTILIFTVSYFINEQSFVNEKNYLLSLKESHIVWIKTNYKVLDNSNISNEVKNFINNNTNVHYKEIKKIDKLLDKIK